MTDLAIAGKLFDVNVDQVTRPLPLESVDWWFGVQVSQPPYPQAVENPRHGDEGRDQQPGDVAEVAALLTETTACCICCGLSLRRFVRRTLRRSAREAAPPEG
jgi:hypothetical protein